MKTILKTLKKKKITSAINKASRPVRWIWPRLSEAVIGFFALILIVFCCLTYSPSISIYTSRLFSGNRYLALIDGMFNPFRNRHLLLKSGLPIYDLKISHQQFALLESVAEQAKKKGWLSEDLQVWANAQFIYQGEKFNVKVRIRGDLSPHWKDPKKSYRIKFIKQRIHDNGQVFEEPIYFQGKRQINLIIPQDRDYILCYFINSILRQAGLVVPRDQYVILRINGVIHGLYYEVEHFDKPLLAYNNRPETPIFGQNSRAMHFEQYTKLGMPAVSDAKFDIGSLQRSVDLEDQLGYRAMQILINHSLDPTPENFKRVRAVLDWDKYLRFRVLTTLCNTNHVKFGSDNLKLFYDASRGLLEPIPWDLHLTQLPKEPGTIDFWNNHGLDEIQRATLLDPMLRLQRNKILWEIVGDGGDKLLAKYRAIHDRFRPFAWADVLGTPIHAYKMDLLKKVLEYNVHRIYTVLKLSNANVTFRLEAENRAALEVTTLNFSGIYLKKISLSELPNAQSEFNLYQDANNNGMLDQSDPLIASATADHGSISFDVEQYVFPELVYKSDFIEGRYWEFFDTLAGRRRFFIVGRMTDENHRQIEWQLPQIQVTAANAVTGKEIPSYMLEKAADVTGDYVGIIAFNATDPFDLEAPEFTLDQFLQAHPEFKASERRIGAAELSGTVVLTGATIIPKSVPLLLAPGTDITMKPNASVLCYGGLTSLGTSENRVKIHGDGSGQPWGTFAVARPPEKVVMKYTDFSDGGQAHVNGILFTGGFAVHNGDLEADNCSFVGMQSEDSANLKNGHIAMNHCLFSNTASDGFDIDFGIGEIKDTQFIHVKGDGLDLSGSKVTLAQNRFEDVGDKGISVGEDSHPVIINNLFRDCSIGISTKDLSFAQVAYCTFVSNRLAVEAKRKKPMFGAGSGELVNCVFAENDSLLREDYFSRGLVRIKNSVVDHSVAWQDCITAPIKFAASEQDNFLIDADSINGKRYIVAKAEWINCGDGNVFPGQPGIYTYQPIK